MELFAIHCTTCKARLRVQDESAIGEILACPKCHSMVHVAPPVDWKPGAAKADASKVITTGSTIGLPKMKAPSDVATVAAAVAAKVVPPKIAKTAPPQVAKTAPPIPQTVAPPVAAPPVVAAVVTPPPVAETVAAGSIISRIPRDGWMFGGGAAAGVLIGAAIWMLLTLTGTTSKPPVAVNVASATPVVEEQVVPEIGEEVAIEPAPQIEKTETTRHVVAKPQAVDEAVAESPESIQVAAVEESVTKPEVAPIAEAPEPAKAEEPAPAVEPVIAKADAPDEETPKVTGPPADPVISKLNDVLPKAEFKQMPLRQFVGFLSDFSGVKITIDAASLQAAGRDAIVPISISKSDATVAELLKAALAPAGLRYELRNGSVVILAK